MGKIKDRIASARAATNRTRKPVKAGFKQRGISRAWFDENQKIDPAPAEKISKETMKRISDLSAGLMRAYTAWIGTMERHELMQGLANDAKELGVKGKYGLLCNRTQCLGIGATWYNRGSYAFYCHECATMLNRENRTTAEEFLGAGQALCIQVTSEEEAANLHVMG